MRGVPLKQYSYLVLLLAWQLGLRDYPSSLNNPSIPALYTACTHSVAQLGHLENRSAVLTTVRAATDDVWLK